MRRGFLGGSFNPPHIGHLRMGVEACDRLGLEQVELLPAYVPPHKPGAGILPFELRLAMLRAAIGEDPQLTVSTLEEELPRPSYTIRTMRHVRGQEPASGLVFIMGAGDFEALPKWHRGLELIGVCDLAVLDRLGATREEIMDGARCFWPEHDLHWRGDDIVGFPDGARITFVETTRMDVSATRIRELWREGRRIDYLTPEPVVRLLRTRSEEIDACWAREECA
jgi:nicotinate-nucleotide adenylyltransferase